MLSVFFIVFISLAIVFPLYNILWACSGFVRFVCLSTLVIHHLWIKQLWFHLNKIWKYDASRYCVWYFIDDDWPRRPISHERYRKILFADALFPYLSKKICFFLLTHMVRAHVFVPDLCWEGPPICAEVTPTSWHITFSVYHLVLHFFFFFYFSAQNYS